MVLSYKKKLQNLFSICRQPPKRPIEGIASGRYDAQVSQVLAMTAIPGYSRHHTGYTVDIACKNNPNASFVYTVCFQWLNADNYKNAKTYGWIPSYPDGAGQQGPDREPWEYVWVGVDAVTE
jgi:LAS superfamily LD-carboxypeptidase LdcB